MPSTYTPSLRLEMQAAGENLNTWGAPRLNAVIDRLDQAVAGRSAIALNGDHVLTSANAGDDEARRAMLDFSGTGPAVVTLPATSKIYLVRNAASGPVTLTTGAGAVATIDSQDVTLVACDGANVFPLGVGGLTLKAYVEAVAWSYNAGALPGQAGNAGKVVFTDGEAAGWRLVTSLPDYIHHQAQSAAAADWRAAGLAYFG
ncbi:hypothetical protein [Phenylobacterium sp.]|uniref:hypothetical protein n=1 Tax=Phenylobacterium sp. TaxID=1871053 RepID=UPI002730E320|nr:hypothetical protein [Phenylobacterium sp.]MDP1616780.1 hypothetical protein [Phenylobacterium sp.]MDP1988274.1 hypothetical protein [Phenylobacterium sp.]